MADMFLKDKSTIWERVHHSLAGLFREEIRPIPERKVDRVGYQQPDVGLGKVDFHIGNYLASWSKPRPRA
jgi:hypothetical protein